MPDSIDRELAVFSDARRLPPEQRSAFLDEACASDLDLRRQVEELLCATDETPAFMEMPAGRLLNPAEFSRSVATEKPGDYIGH